jgi:hypothetical protein
MTANLMFEVGQAKIHDLYATAERRHTVDQLRAANRTAHAGRVSPRRRSLVERVLSVW